MKLPEVTEKDMDLPPRKRYLREVKRKYQEWLQEKRGESASQCGKRTEDEYDSDLDSIMEERGVHPTTLSDDDDEDKALKELMKQFLTPRKNSTLTRSQTTKLCSFSLAQGYVDIPANERVKVTEWGRYVLPNGITIRSSTMVPHNATRAASTMRFEFTEVNADGLEQVRSGYGIVRFFFTLKHSGNTLGLVYISEYLIASMGDFLYRADGSLMDLLIPATDIKELVDIITAKG